MTKYGDAFFDEVRASAIDSASVIVPTFVQEVGRAGKVVDVGCGEGWFGAEFEKFGFSATGVDDSETSHQQLKHFFKRDLEDPRWIDDFETFDYAVCLEVAEHLSPGRAEGFIHELTWLVPTVLFSAAIPGQGGHGHHNEQWTEYWVKLFEGEGFHVSGALRPRIWGDDAVAPWYRQNLLVASAQPDRYPGIFTGAPDAKPWTYVHPTVFQAVAQEAGRL